MQKQHGERNESSCEVYRQTRCIEVCCLNGNATYLLHANPDIVELRHNPGNECTPLESKK